MASGMIHYVIALNVLEYIDVIKQYIEESTKLCLDELNALREQWRRVDPSQYYVMA
jgi:hypothetical protein